MLLVGLQACVDDDGTDVDLPQFSISDIEGSWNAVRAEFDIAGTGPSLAVDIVQMGGSVTLVIQSTGRFTLTIIEDGEGPEVSTGQMFFDRDILVIEFDDNPGEPEFFGIQSTDTTLSLAGGAEYDLDNDGNDDPARVELDFIRI